MTSDADLVELTTAKTALEAEWLIGALKRLGVQAVSFGGMLADEFAMSQKLMGLSGGVRIMVARGELEQAREALAQLERDRPSPEEFEAAVAAATAQEEEVGEPGEPKGGSSGNPLAMVLLVGAVVALGWLSIHQHTDLSAWEQASPVSETVWRGDHWETRWRHNGRVASRGWDRDGNGVTEEAWHYDRDGALVAKAFDANQNEVYELTIDTDAEGNERCRSVDANENGIVERFEYPARDGVREQWIDADEDRRFERYEFVDAESGEVLDAFEDRGREGFQRVE